MLQKPKELTAIAGYYSTHPICEVMLNQKFFKNNKLYRDHHVSLLLCDN